LPLIFYQYESWYLTIKHSFREQSS